MNGMNPCLFDFLKKGFSSDYYNLFDGRVVGS